MASFATESASLLPTTHAQFASKAYWDDFFKKSDNSGTLVTRQVALLLSSALERMRLEYETREEITQKALESYMEMAQQEESRKRRFMEADPESTGMTLG